MDRDADLNTPASTPSGRIDGMVVAHAIGRGAPELVRFYGESALVREPDVLLFGLERVDLPEQEFLSKSPMRHVWAADIQKKGAASSMRDALAHLHTESRDFVLHLDTDIIAQQEFPAVNVPGSGGLRLEEVRAALREALSQRTLLGLDVAQYNPERDPDGSAAQKLVALLVDALSVRMEGVSTEAPAAEPKAALEVEPASAPVLPAEDAVTEQPVAGETVAEDAAAPETTAADSQAENSNSQSENSN
jgi:arginase